ncbi:hypothetical protein LSCM1_06914 [Leishmania martiniquensis]|uniref:Uncharacterized protein n=1 Tax=Leishmania martiniquensis TaxID=1580590 RepID=A0A836HEY1_9TRYP|nr:hypothetical protein LSCM1_06914 [Leishmania martiniquensis]
MMSFPRDGSGRNSVPIVRPLQQHQRQRPAQTPTASSQEYERCSNSPRSCNPSTAVAIPPNGQQHQHNLQPRPSHQKPPATNMYTPTPASPVKVGGSPDTQLPMASVQQQQQHGQVAPSPSRHSSSLELSNPNMVQLYGRLPAASAAAGVPGLIGTAPIAASPAHRRSSLPNSNSANSGHTSYSSLLLGQRLQSDLVGTASPASMAAITSFTTRPSPAHRAPPHVTTFPTSPHSPVSRGSDGTYSPLQEQQNRPSPGPSASMHGRVLAAAPDSTNLHVPSLASSPSWSQQQQQLQLLSTGVSGAAPKGMIPFNTATTAPSSLPSPWASATQTTATTTSLSAFVDLDDIRQAHERPFRFKMLPPPPPYERFLALWEMNASDRRTSQATTRGEDTCTNSITHQQRVIARGDSHSSAGTASPMERGNMEAMLHPLTGAHADPCRPGIDLGALSAAEEERASDAAAPCETAAAMSEFDNDRISAVSHHSTPERAAMVTQYHHILERWWAHTVIFEGKLGVRQHLGNLHLCPSFADAQRAVAAASAPASPVRVGSGTFDDVPADARVINELTAPEESAAFPVPAPTANPLVAEEVVLQVWSALALQWWEETKRCLCPRRGCRGAPRRGTPSTRIDDNGVGSSRSGSDVRDAASLASVNSYDFPSTAEDRLTRSLPPPDHDTLLHFDFTMPSAFSSPTDSLQI